MLSVARWRIILVAVATILGVLLSLPNFLPSAVRDAMPGFLPRQTLNLGLDLQGGSYLLLEVDTDTLREQQLENVADQMAQALRDAEPAIRYTGRGVVGNAARLRLVNREDMARALRAFDEIGAPGLGAQGGDNDIRFAEAGEGLIEARLSDDAMRALSRQAAQQSIEVIRRRIDPTGTSEVSIQRQGDDRIVVQAPGMSDPEQLKERIGTTALLTFHMVAENVDPESLATGRLPPGTIYAQPYADIGRTGEVVRRRPFLTGEHLTDATPRTDPQTQAWVMSMNFDSQGLRIFCRLTTENVGKRFAILLDDQVLTAPVIRGPICGSGGQIEGNFTYASVNELSLMLRAGALPAPLSVIEERSVGAGLGQEAINSGAIASMIGAIAVVVIMLFAYGEFGVIAIVALVVNMLLLLAAMSTIGAALTLPGIAGLILTLGMAVDSNVLIYERMREEQALGRTPALAVDGGFRRALVTILDANLTTIIAALILFQFGAGPVRGFAWTLSIGCVTTVFTATLVTQILVAGWFRMRRPKTLPM